MKFGVEIEELIEFMFELFRCWEAFGWVSRLGVFDRILL